MAELPERLYRKLVLQVEAPTRERAEAVADAMQARFTAALEEGVDDPDACTELLHEADAWDEEE